MLGTEPLNPHLGSQPGLQTPHSQAALISSKCRTPTPFMKSLLTGPALVAWFLSLIHAKKCPVLSSSWAKGYQAGTWGDLGALEGS